MECPHCNSNNIIACRTRTNLGYLECYCKDCKRQYNERTETLFNFIASLMKL